MKLEVTELGPSKRALKIEIPEEEVTKRFTKVYAELSRQVKIPGFRPGKAPRALLEKRYAKNVEEDVIRSLVPDFYTRAVRQAGIVPVDVEIPPLERIKIKKDSTLSFTATVEIKPTIELRDYKPPNPISLKPDNRTITPDLVDRALETLREQQAQLHPAPADKVISEGDFAELHIEGFLGLEPLEGSKKENHLHRVGSGETILGVEVDEALLGQKEGESVEISQPYPDSHPDTRMAGQTVRFRIKVTGIKEKKLPDLDDEFAKDCGHYESLVDLRDKVQAEMERALKKDIQEKHKDALLKRLEETHHFEIPEILLDRELTPIVRNILDKRHKQGIPPTGDEEATLPPQEEVKRLREEHLPAATRRVKLGLILEAIADREGLTVEEEDIQAEIKRLADELKMPIEHIQKLVVAGGDQSRDELTGRILAEKSLDFVYRHSVIQG